MSRLLRVNAELREQLSAIIRDRVGDPRVQLASVARVVVSGDLQHARVYISCLGSLDEQQVVIRVLQHAKGFIRRELGRSIRMRYTPDLVFALDDSAERLLAMDQQLRTAPDEERPVDGE